MATCKECGAKVSFLSLMEGVCDACRDKERILREQAAASETAQVAQEQFEVDESLKSIILTTEAVCGLEITERLGIVATEVVIGQHLGKEFLTGVRDIVGGRSKSLQKTFREGREIAFQEIRQEAFNLGADAVVAVDIDYLDVSGGGTMPMVCVSGTAVKLKTGE